MFQHMSGLSLYDLGIRVATALKGAGWGNTGESPSSIKNPYAVVVFPLSFYYPNILPDSLLTLNPVESFHFTAPENRGCSTCQMQVAEG